MRIDTHPQEEARAVMLGEWREHCQYERQLIDDCEERAVRRAKEEVFRLAGKWLAVTIAIGIAVALLIRVGMSLR